MAEITAAAVKALRDQTGAGMMDCKKVLKEADGDLDKAVELLREQGLAKAGKREGRATSEGVIALSLAGGTGAMIELGCETDFVARTDEFRAVAKDIAMHVAAQNPLVVSREELAEDVVARERAIYREQALDSGKPKKIVDKIVDGRIEKYYAEVCLLEQPFVKDTDITIEDYVKQTIASLGENIRIGRFVRMKLGEASESEGKPARDACCS